MTRIFKFSIILFIIMMCVHTTILASGINMDLSNNSASNTSTNTTDNTVYGANTVENTDTARTSNVFLRTAE
ncbi:MAG: hypothetical protein HFJ24_06410, partial [Clostridia bacterium]|nr:hypothetical protein [Clostridia bacterium]